MSSTNPPKRAREEYEEADNEGDLSDGELDAAILSNPINTKSEPLSTAALEGGLFAEADEASESLSSASSENDENVEESDKRLSALGRDEHIRVRLAAAQAAMLPIISNLTPEQQMRYETFRRVGFPRPFIKKLIAKAWGGAGTGSALASAVIVIAGIAKVFVGELVETAREVAVEWGEVSEGRPLLPSHYREAHRRLVNAGRIKPSIDNVQSCLL